MQWNLLYNAHPSGGIHSTSAEGSVLAQKVLVLQEQPHLYVRGVAVAPDVIKYCC